MKNEPEEERIRPFSMGTQAMDWMSNNCWVCTRERTCNLHRDLVDGIVAHRGEITRAVADRMGVPENTWSDWTCKEFETKPLPGPGRDS